MEKKRRSGETLENGAPMEEREEKQQQKKRKKRKQDG